MRSRRRPLLAALGWLSLYAVLAIALTAPLSLHPGSRLPDDGDAPQGAWIVWWGATHLFDGYPAILDANAYHPHPRGLLYSEPMLAQALLAWPLYRLLDAALATNLLMIATLAMSAAAMHLLAQDLTGSRPAAMVAAVAYVFSAYTFFHLPRLQLVTLQWIPLLLLFLHRHVTRGQRRYAWLFGATAALQVLACLYYAAFVALACAILLPVYGHATGQWRRVVRLVSCTLLVAGPMAGLLAWEYRRLYRIYGFTGEAPLLDLVQLFRPSREQLLYGRVLGVPEASVSWGGEHFLGYVVLALACLGAVRLVRGETPAPRVVWIAYLGLGVMAALLAAGPEVVVGGVHLGPGPFALLGRVPAFDTMRDPGRITVLSRLVLALFAARAVAGFSRRRWPTAALAATALVADQWSPALTRGVELPVGAQAPEVYRWIAGRPDAGPVVDLPVLPYRFTRFTSLEAYFSTLHRQRIVMARPSFSPPALELLQWELRSFPDARSLALLRSMGVRFAVVHPGRWEDPAEQKFALRRLDERSQALPLLASFPPRARAPLVRYHLGDERVYGVAAVEEERVPAECRCAAIPRASLQATGSGRSDPHLALDGRRDTRWTTGREQRPGDFFEMLLDRPRRITRIEIPMGFPYGEFGRNLEAVAFQGTTEQAVRLKQDPAYLAALVRQLVARPAEARLRYDFEPVVADRLRLLIAADEYGAPGWSIPEIDLYEVVQALPPGEPMESPPLRDKGGSL